MDIEFCEIVLENIPAGEAFDAIREEAQKALDRAKRGEDAAPSEYVARVIVAPDGTVIDAAGCELWELTRMGDAMAQADYPMAEIRAHARVRKI